MPNPGDYDKEIPFSQECENFHKKLRVFGPVTFGAQEGWKYFSIWRKREWHGISSVDGVQLTGSLNMWSISLCLSRTQNWWCVISYGAPFYIQYEEKHSDDWDIACCGVGHQYARKGPSFFCNNAVSKLKSAIYIGLKVVSISTGFSERKIISHRYRKGENPTVSQMIYICKSNKTSERYLRPRIELRVKPCDAKRSVAWCNTHICTSIYKTNSKCG